MNICELLFMPNLVFFIVLLYSYGQVRSGQVKSGQLVTSGQVRAVDLLLVTCKPVQPVPGPTKPAPPLAHLGLARRVARHPVGIKNKIHKGRWFRRTTCGHLAPTLALGNHCHHPSLLSHGSRIKSVKGWVSHMHAVPHLKIHCAGSRNLSSTSKPCSDGKGVKRQVEDDTGSHSSNPACRQFRILVVCLPTQR